VVIIVAKTSHPTANPAHVITHGTAPHRGRGLTREPRVKTAAWNTAGHGRRRRHAENVVLQVFRHRQHLIIRKRAVPNHDFSHSPIRGFAVAARSVAVVDAQLLVPRTAVATCGGNLHAVSVHTLRAVRAAHHKPVMLVPTRGIGRSHPTVVVRHAAPVFPVPMEEVAATLEDTAAITASVSGQRTQRPCYRKNSTKVHRCARIAVKSSNGCAFRANAVVIIVAKTSHPTANPAHVITHGTAPHRGRGLTREPRVKTAAWNTAGHGRRRRHAENVVLQVFRHRQHLIIRKRAVPNHDFSHSPIRGFAVAARSVAVVDAQLLVPRTAVATCGGNLHAVSVHTLRAVRAAHHKPVLLIPTRGIGRSHPSVVVRDAAPVVPVPMDEVAASLEDTAASVARVSSQRTQRPRRGKNLTKVHLRVRVTRQIRHLLLRTVATRGIPAHTTPNRNTSGTSDRARPSCAGVLAFKTRDETILWNGIR